VTADTAGKITITIEGDAVGSARLVVFADSNGDADLSLNADNQPTDAFGVGGETTFVPMEAANNDSTAGVVKSVDKTGDSFVIGTKTFFYDANDSFKIAGAAVTMEAFKADLSTGDTLAAGNYTKPSSLTSTFDIGTNTPLVPTVNGALTTSKNDSVTITVTPNDPAYADMGAQDEFVVWRTDWDANSDGNDDGTCDAYQVAAGVTLDDAEYEVKDYTEVFRQTKAAEDAADGVTDVVFKFIDGGLAPGCYAYFAQLVVNGDATTTETSVAGDDGFGYLGDEAPVAGPYSISTVETVKPTMTNARVTTDANGEFGDTDVIKLAFSENMAAGSVADGVVVRFTDPDGGQWDIVCGPANAGQGNVCVLGDDGSASNTNTADQIQITLGTDSAVKTGGSAAGTTAVAEIPGQITALSSAIKDLSGNVVDLAASADTLMDVELA
jgi:uncharacterized protein (DUF2141 family)